LYAILFFLIDELTNNECRAGGIKGHILPMDIHSFFESFLRIHITPPSPEIAVN